MATKQCTRCLDDKDLELFNKDAHSPDGRAWRCKDCKSELHSLRKATGWKRPYLKKDPVADAEQKRRRRLKIKTEVFSHYCGGKPHCMCLGCDVTEIAFLTIDHVDGDGNKHRRSLKIGRGSGQKFYVWLQKHSYPPGYQVLCANCNMAKGAFGACPHTTKPQDLIDPEASSTHAATVLGGGATARENWN